MVPDDDLATLEPARSVAVVGRDQANAVSRILASAFYDDPLLNWISGNRRLYYGFFYAEAEALYSHHRHMYCNAEGSGAAMWLPANIDSQPPFHWRLLVVMLRLLANEGFAGLKRAEYLSAAMAERHITEPHFYLRSIGAMQGQQGRGIGSALLKAGLAACDAAKLPAYLESSNEKNNPLYERFGFEVFDEFSVMGDGPRIWFMQRPAMS